MRSLIKKKTGIEAVEERYRIFFENSGISMMFVSEDTTIALINREFENLTGYSKALVEGKLSWTGLIAAPADLERMMEYHRLRRIDPDTAPGVYDTKIKTRDGAIRDVMIRVTMIPETTYSLASMLDITERKNAEEAIRESEEKYRSLVNNMQDTLYRCDAKGNITFVSPSGARLLGHDSAEEMIGKNIAADYYYNPEERELLLHELKIKGAITNYEVTLKRKDGSPVIVTTNSHLFHGRDGTIAGVEGIFSNITQRKSMEEEVNRLAAIVRHSSELVNLADLDGNMIFLNEAGSKMLGIDHNNMEKTNILDVIPDHLKGLVENEMLPSLLAGRGWEGDLQYKNLKTGELTDVHSVTFVIEDPDVRHHKYLANISLDISRRKKTEMILRENEERLRAITTNIPGAVYQFYATENGEYGMSYASEAMTELFGLQPDLDTLFPEFLAHVHDDDRERFSASIRKAVDTFTAWNFEGRFVKPSGEIMWFNGISTPSRHEDRLVFDGILLNINERKRVEEALEKRIMALTRPLEDTAGIAFEDLFNIDDIQRLQDEFARATGVASIITHTDGTPITAPSEFCRLCIDIIRKTDRGLANCYRSDAVLGRYSTKGPAIQTCMSGGLWDAGAGISIGGRHIANWLIGQVRDETQNEENMRAYAREIGADEEAVIGAFREVPAMTREQFQLVAQALFTLANQLSAFAYQNVQQARFIAERKEAEEMSRHSEDKFRKVFMTTPDCIVITRLVDGRIMDVNHGFEDISGWKSSEVLGRTSLEINVWGNAAERDLMVADLKAGRDVLHRESLFRRKDGSQRNVIYSARSITIAGETCIIFILQDITDRKQAEASLRNSLEEKEVLLKELYHRTKNNMQVICSLLNLQTARVNEPIMRDICTEIQTKIQTMALVHQKLYESKDLANINLSEFVKSLSDLIMKNHTLPQNRLTIRQSVDSIPISIDTAMPLGLVLNELISNSIKHAFPGDRHGEILIDMHSIGEGIRLEYRDNGTGLSEGFDPALTDTLGMKIIQNISEKQLGGSISFLQEKGFGCMINIKTNLYHRRI